MIKLLVSISGVDSDGEPFSHVPGAEVSFKDKAMEKRLVESGQAEDVRKRPIKAKK